MISYYPLEDDIPPPRPVIKKEEVVEIKKSIFDGETTECNYLVFAFIAGVLFLALVDFMKQR
jgi:hypothetical protein